MSKAEYKKKMAAEKSDKAEIKISNADDFKVALSAICNNTDYKTLKEQFFGKAEK